MNKTIKIAFTVTSDIAYDQRMQRICTALANEEFTPVLIGQSSNNNKYPFKTITISPLFKKGKLFYAEYNIRLFFILLFQKFNGICAIDLDTIIPAYYVAKWKKIKFIYDAHEYFTASANLINRKKEQKIWKRIEQHILPHIKYAYTVNQSIADLFEQEYASNIQCN
jgi:hypothetical protein